MYCSQSEKPYSSEFVNMINTFSVLLEIAQSFNHRITREAPSFSFLLWKDFKHNQKFRE